MKLHVQFYADADTIPFSGNSYKTLMRKLKKMFAEGHERERKRSAAMPKTTHNAREKALQWLEEKDTGYKWKPEPDA